jgi:hypothetical protein
MRLSDEVYRPTGHFHLEVFQGGEVIEVVDEPNLVVDASKFPLSRLIGGTVANNSVTTFGVGTNGATPSAGNTVLTSSFTKAFDSVTFPATNQVSFNFSLGTTEANGVAILEFGLLTAAGTLFARKTRASALNKASDISFTGAWVITF